MPDSQGPIEYGKWTGYLLALGAGLGSFLKNRKAKSHASTERLDSLEILVSELRAEFAEMRSELDQAVPRIRSVEVSLREHRREFKDNVQQTQDDVARLEETLTGWGNRLGRLLRKLDELADSSPTQRHPEPS